MENNKKSILDETVIAGNRIFAENNEAKVILSEDSLNGGYIDVETAKTILYDLAEKTYALE